MFLRVVGWLVVLSGCFVGLPQGAFAEGGPHTFSVTVQADSGFGARFIPDVQVYAAQKSFKSFALIESGDTLRLLGKTECEMMKSRGVPPAGLQMLGQKNQELQGKYREVLRQQYLPKFPAYECKTDARGHCNIPNVAYGEHGNYYVTAIARLAPYYLIWSVPVSIWKDQPGTHEVKLNFTNAVAVGEDCQ